MSRPSIAVVGASSQIAKDLIGDPAFNGRARLLLYVRDEGAMARWLKERGLDGAAQLKGYAEYGADPHEAVINFVGIGDPRRAAEMGPSIIGVTQEFDDLVLRHLPADGSRRYIFLSSGAAYGGPFDEPAGDATPARIAINALAPQDFYGVAKLHAEAKHRSLAGRAIVDLRVFNYFSRTQDLAARFLVTDALRAIQSGQELQTTADEVTRDYLHPSDFRRLVDCVLGGAPMNGALDCYSKAPIAKSALLAALQKEFGLRYKVAGAGAAVNATGLKPHYYSTSRRAAGLGYRPELGSWDGLRLEAAAALGR